MKKNIFSNFIYNTLFTILNLVFPLITIPYISRVIGVQGIGKVNFATSIINYFLMIASLGIPLYGVREIAKSRNDKEVLSKTFSEIFIINLISSLFCIILYYIMIIKIDSFKKDYLLYLVCGLNLVLNIFNLDWFYKGLEEYKYITIRSLLVKLISLVFLFMFVKTKDDYITYSFINILAISGNNLINIISVNNFIKFTVKNLNIKQRLQPIFILLSVQISVNIYVNLDVTMCGIIAGNESVGYYSNAMKISKLATSIVSSVSVIMLPTLSNYIRNNRKSEFEKLVNETLKALIFISIPAMVGMFLLSDEIIKVICGSEFIPAILTLKILSSLTIILSIGNLFGTQVLMTLGKENMLLKSVIIGATTNLILNIILIPIFEHNGAAIATVISETLVMVAQVYVSMKFVEIKFNDRFIYNVIISSSFMTVTLLVIKLIISNDILVLILSVISGVITYVLTNIYLKESIIIQALSIIEERIKVR